MRSPLLDSLGRDRVGTSITRNIPAPTGGWNTLDSVAEMDPLDATVLDNWFPRAGLCQLRGGSYDYATGMTGTVKSLFTYCPTSGSNKLFAATDAGIYDVTAGGAIGSVAATLTYGYISGVTLVNSAGTAYWWGANGRDPVQLFDGSTWTTITSGITQIASDDLISPWLFKHRIFAIEDGKFNLWYLPIDSIQGEAGKLPLGNLFKRGGYLLAGTSWTLDSGDGPDDLLVVISTEGEIAVYKGIDPTSASSWSIVGVYYVGKPLNSRCFFRAGGDVGVLLEGGAFRLSTLLGSGSVNYSKALSAKIQPSFTTQVNSLGVTAQGWEGVIFPKQDALLVNLPGISTQYALNTVTGSWSSFSGWPAKCFAVYNDLLYFGTDGGKVRRAWDTGVLSDMTFDIVSTVHQAWNYFGARTRLKKVNVFRPLLAYDGPVETRWAISPDYSPVTISSILLREEDSSGPPWNISPWDTTAWGSSTFRLKLWRAASHVPGYALALLLQTASNASNISWAGTDYILDSGGAI